MIIGTLKYPIPEREGNVIITVKDVKPSRFFQMAYDYQSNTINKESFDSKRAWKTLNALNTFYVVYKDDFNGNLEITLNENFINARQFNFKSGYLSRIKRISDSPFKVQLYIDDLLNVHLLCFEKFQNWDFHNNMNTFNNRFKRLLYELSKKPLL